VSVSDTIERIKAYRNEHPGCSLLEAKNAVEHPDKPRCQHGELTERECLRCDNDRLRARLAEVEGALADLLESGKPITGGGGVWVFYGDWTDARAVLSRTEGREPEVKP